MARMDIVNRNRIGRNSAIRSYTNKDYGAVPFSPFNYCENSLIKPTCPSKMHCETKWRLIATENYITLSNLLDDGSNITKKWRRTLKI
jgi:hypothetical protein